LQRPAHLLRAPSLSGALPALAVCSSEQVQVQVQQLDKIQSRCPGHAWWPHFIAAAMTCKPVTVVNVGANKGYSLASFADLFVPEMGLTPAAIYSRILARFGDSESGGSVNYPCGACNDCEADHLHSVSARTCVLPSGQEVPATHFSTDIYGFEPIAANIDIIRAGVMAVANEASVPNAQIHLHRAAVVGDAALEEVPFGICPPGLERCGVEAAGTAGEVATWNSDQVMVENVPATTVDAMAAKFGIEADFDVLAVDTEGLDPEVIDGAAGMLKAHRIQLLEFEYRA
jgi:FkbM family methyltransferase